MKALYRDLARVALIYCGLILVAAPTGTMQGSNSNTLVSYGPDIVAIGTVGSVSYSSLTKETTFLLSNTVNSRPVFFAFKYKEGQGDSKIKNLIDSLACLKSKKIKITTICDKNSTKAYVAYNFQGEFDMHIFNLGTSFNQCALKALYIY